MRIAVTPSLAAGPARRPRWLHRRATLVAAFVGLLAAAGITAALSDRSGPSGAPGPGVRTLGPAPATERLSFTLVLRLPGAARLKAALAAIENPSSPQYRHFIDPHAFGRRFGISGPQLALLERQLRASGVRTEASYPQRTALGVSGTVATVSRLLHVQIVNYADAAGHRWHAPTGAPVIPASLAGAVSAATGLDTRPRFLSHDVPMGGLTPQTAPNAYDIAPLAGLGISGQGMKIAVLSFSDYNRGDPGSFDQTYGLSGPSPQVISVDGGTSSTSGADEANLDIDVIQSVAPAAQILFYEIPQTSSAYSDVINRIVADHSTNIISTSWGECELNLGSGERAADAQALSAAVAAGVSLFDASGDSGAYDCQDADLTDHRLSVEWPAASANAIGVGGTRLYLNPDGSYSHEAGWLDVLSHAGGGGGLTTGDARPSWQAAPGVMNQFSNGHRQVPDVSADADPATGWSAYFNGNLGVVGGTSAATPFWAASMLLIEQYAKQHGVSKLGFVGPVLYALASTPQPFPPYHDVTLGGNRYYEAKAGWDFATGLGSPDVYNLARDMVAYLRAHGAR